MTKNAETQKAKYWRRRNAFQCVQCEAGLPDERKGVSIYCVECDEARREAQERYRDKNRSSIQKRQAARMRAVYAKDPAGHAKRKRDERNGRKIDGKCYHCTADALPDSNFCQKHLDENRANSRERARIRTGFYDRHPEVPRLNPSRRETAATVEAESSPSIPPDESARASGS